MFFRFPLGPYPAKFFFGKPSKTLPNFMPRVDFEQKKLQPKSFVLGLSQFILVCQALKTRLGCVGKGGHQGALQRPPPNF